jgi:F0F1-type ATP synthase delta subunit
MLRRVVLSQLSRVSKFANRTPLVFNSFQRANIFIDFPKDDKFTKENAKYPALVEGIKGDYAKDLFRLGYNTDQLGYFRISLDLIQDYADTHGGLPLDYSSLQKEFKDKELAPEVLEQFMKVVYDKGLVRDFKGIVEDYNQLYNSQFNVALGTITFGAPIAPKYANFINKIKMAAVGTLAEDCTRVVFTNEYSTGDFGGWKADIGGMTIDSTEANQLEVLVGSTLDVRQVLDD